ncbi:Uncharacterised protein [Flavonifractor plautii]|uniref:Uncharacterized protein n=1 Tax=Flavonifractor plautii TaxID=292800 RepID=A0A174HRI1_FLAPL|nr:Uncharacterised protein [Flavonifractor plautii]
MPYPSPLANTPQVRDRARPQVSFPPSRFRTASPNIHLPGVYPQVHRSRGSAASRMP